MVMVSAKKIAKAQRLLDEANRLDAERRALIFGTQHYQTQRRNDLFAHAKVLREEARKILQGA